MDRDLATIVVHAAHRSGRELADLIPLLKEHCDAADCERISMGLAKVLHEIEAKICQPLYDEHPDLAREVESRVERFGRMS